MILTLGGPPARVLLPPVNCGKQEKQHDALSAGGERETSAPTSRVLHYKRGGGQVETQNMTEAGKHITGGHGCSRPDRERPHFRIPFRAARGFLLPLQSKESVNF